MAHPIESNPQMPNRSVLWPFLILFGACIAMVLSFGLAGPGIMSVLARHDPDPILRDRAATLSAARNLILDGLDAEIPESEWLARDHGQGTGLVNCLVMGARAEKAGRPAEAYLWFALDAHGRRMPDAVKAYEDEAIRLANSVDSTDRTEALNRILPQYSSLLSKLDDFASAQH